MIANIDENMGRLLAMLDERDLRDNTILIYHDRQRGHRRRADLQCRHARPQDRALRRRPPRSLFHSLARRLAWRAARH